MRAAKARGIARGWVAEHGSALPGFAGAFFHGSINWLPEDAELPPTSDVDVMVVLEAGEWSAKPGKFMYRGVLLEVSYLDAATIGSVEDVLGQYHLAGSFQAASIIEDPTGRLTELQRGVAADYTRRRWVRRRCEHAREKVLHGFALRDEDPFPTQVIAWLFPTGILTHLLLAAGLRNPTVRTRYLAARRLLAEYGENDVYALLLELLGCAAMGQERAAEHLASLADAFDAAKDVTKTPFFFAADISDVGRPVAIGGSQELIAQGDHREAVFWMAATYARCQLVFHHDAPELSERFDRGFRALLGDLGIASVADVLCRRTETALALPVVWEAAERIMAANRDITDCAPRTIGASRVSAVPETSRNPDVLPCLPCCTIRA